jgi:hypothetical protein
MRCPVCKADNDQGPACRRCKADLSLLWALEARREALLASVRHRLARFNPAAVTSNDNPVTRLEARIERRQIIEDVNAATQIRADTDTAKLTAIARLLTRDFAGAWRAYLAAKAPTESESAEAAGG